jgi:tetratricopeptide (TPR) repeat protein
VLDGLEALVEQSLLQQRELNGEPRFVMLETIREFAAEQLKQSGEAEEIRSRHAAAFLSLAEQAAPHLTAGEQRTWLDRLEREHDNLRAAMEWAIERREAETALRLGAALWRFWQIRGYLSEARGRLERAVSLKDKVRDPAVLAAALQAGGGIAYWQADFDAALRFYADELELRRQLGDRAALAYALYCLSMTYTFLGMPSAIDQARPHAEEGLALYRELGDEVGVATLLWCIACVEYYAGRDFEQARQTNLEAIEIIRPHDQPFVLNGCLYLMAMLDLAQGDMDGARRNMLEALGLARQGGDVSGYALIVAGASWDAWALADRERAMRLAGAANVLETSSGARLAERNRDVTGSFRAEDQLGDPELRAAYEEGQAMSSEEAAAYAEEVLGG